MTASRCLHEAQRIAQMPTTKWAGEVMKLPTACGNADCTTGNCQAVCQTWLKVQFGRMRYMKRMRQDDKYAQKGKRR